MANRVHCKYYYQYFRRGILLRRLATLELGAAKGISRVTYTELLLAYQPPTPHTV